MSGTSPKKDYPQGWNDPPILNYSPTNPPPKSRIGNKRVAFPIGASSSNQNTGNHPEVQGIPPLPTSIGDPCVQELYAKASVNFIKLLEQVDSPSIKNQITEMLSEWQSGKLSAVSQSLLKDLSSYIMEGNTCGINEVQLKLAMQTEPYVKNYIQALSYLVSKSKHKTETA
ncbi:uncharacterized protein [Euwallacea similis]|uniref:uncharacterized protein n=1 Tax=Euwallacea similis TaxID=1736056 RepID=UPI003450B8BF